MSITTNDSTQLRVAPAPAAAAAYDGRSALPPLPGVLWNPLYSLRTRRWLALGVFSAIVALGLPLSWRFGTPVYSSEAVVYVSPRFLRNLQEDKEQDLQSNSQYREYVQQNVRTINRYDIVADALAALGPKRALWQEKDETDRRAVERLQRELKILPVPETYQIVVDLESKKREGLADIVNAVVDTYLQKAKVEEFYDADKRVASLRQERERALGEMQAKEERRMQLAQELGVSTFTDAYPNPYDQLLVAAKEALAEAARKRIEADAEWTSLGEDVPADTPSPLSNLAPEQAAQDGTLASLQDSLNQRRWELLAKMGGLPRTDPWRIAAERELAELDREVARAFRGLVAPYASNLWQQKPGNSLQVQLVEKNVQLDRQDRDRVFAAVPAKDERKIQLAPEPGVSPFNFNENNPNLYGRMLGAAKEALAGAVPGGMDTEGGWTPIAGSPLAALAREQAAKDGALTSMQASLNQRRAELLTKMSGLSEAHPGRKAAEREIAELEQEMKRTFQGLVASYSSNLWQQKRGDSLKVHRVEKDLQLEMERQASRASWFAQKFEEGRSVGLDIERVRRRLDAIDDRVNFLSLETQAPGFVHVFSRARPADLPVKGGRTRWFCAFLVAAMLLGVATPVGADSLDLRIRSARGLYRALGFEPLGWFPERGLADEFGREQVLRLANRLDQDRQKTGARIFAFTGSTAGAGTSTTVADTARALAALGVPALAVEANAYRSDHRFSGGNQGLAVVLRGNRDLAEAIVSGGEGAPDHIGVGDVEGKRNLPDIHRLIEVLQVGAESYGIVLIDLPPILLSVDAEYVARTADVVVLVVEAGRTTQAQVRRAAKALERLEPRAVAAVLNRVQIRGLDPAPLQAVEEYECGRQPQPSADIRSRQGS
ncbi:MAG TPA: hypothetical protein VMH81_39930 [Bryobacteraceae bacterium]|nr:hypothetical protein [Bryobacteraceae bacterium]